MLSIINRGENPKNVNSETWFHSCIASYGIELDRVLCIAGRWRVFILWSRYWMSWKWRNDMIRNVKIFIMLNYTSAKKNISYGFKSCEEWANAKKLFTCSASLVINWCICSKPPPSVSSGSAMVECPKQPLIPDYTSRFLPVSVRDSPDPRTTFLYCSLNATRSVFFPWLFRVGSYNMTIQNPKHSFKTKPKILIIIVRRGRDWRLLSFVILLPCLGLFNGLLCVSIGITVWSLPSCSPPTGMQHQKGERECEYDAKPRPLIILGTEKFRNNINNSNNKQWKKI